MSRPCPAGGDGGVGLPSLLGVSLGVGGAGIPRLLKVWGIRSTDRAPQSKLMSDAQSNSQGNGLSGRLGYLHLANREFIGLKYW